MKTKIIIAILFGALFSVRAIAQENIQLITEQAQYQAELNKQNELLKAEQQRKAAELKAQQDAKNQMRHQRRHRILHQRLKQNRKNKRPA